MLTSILAELYIISIQISSIIEQYMCAHHKKQQEYVLQHPNALAIMDGKG